MNAIEIEGLVKSYGKTRALRGIDMTVREGEVHGFIGMNGAGKSTTIRILLGMLKKDAGRVSLLGGDPFADSVALHRRLSYVPGDVNPWPNLTGGEVIDLLSRMRGRVDPSRRAALIDRFAFDPKKPCRSYSKGNRQKVALIAALLPDVELYILDEPTTGLDPLMEAEFRKCVQEATAQGRTVFLSSHILAEVERLCDYVTIIRDGRIVESGSLADMRQLSRLVVTARCERPVEDIRLPGVAGLTLEGNSVSFAVEPEHLNDALKVLTEYRAVSLHCAKPELEDLLLHHYAGGEKG